jgi:NhaA family Na+:H+ antiporter
VHQGGLAPTSNDEDQGEEHITSGLVDERLSPPLEDIDHLRGERGAPLELVMFSDFQCPFCLGAQSVIRRVREHFSDRLVFAFRHLPIVERHPLAQLAAEASEAAAAQGDFWDYHDALFAAQPKLSLETMLAVGRDLGLDAERMAAEIDSGVHRERIARDVASAAASGATGTPTFFVNGIRHFGHYDAPTLIEKLAAGTSAA